MNFIKVDAFNNNFQLKTNLEAKGDFSWSFNLRNSYSTYQDVFQRINRIKSRIKTKQKFGIAFDNLKVEYTKSAKEKLKAQTKQQIKQFRDRYISRSYEWIKEINPEFKKFLIKDMCGCYYSVLPKCVLNNWDFYNISSLENNDSFKLNPFVKGKCRLMSRSDTVRRFLSKWKRKHHYSYLIPLKLMEGILSSNWKNRMKAILETGQNRIEDKMLIIYQ